MAWNSFLLALLTLAHSTHAYYLPLQGPTNYCNEETEKRHGNCAAQVLVHVGALSSMNVLVPYDYFRFGFCLTDEKPMNDKHSFQNLGQFLMGERLELSTYNIKFADNITRDKVLCTKVYESDNKEQESELEFLRERIHESYMHQWVIDNMPVTWCFSIMESDQPFCTTRFPIGCFVTPEGVKHDACYLSNHLSEPGATYVFNHVHLILSYHKGSEQSKFTDGRIVRAQVQLASCKTFPCTPKSEPLKLPKPNEIDKNKSFELNYSYSVEFSEREDIEWSSRWDYILNFVPQSKYQWSVTIYTIFTVLLLTFFAGLIIYHSIPSKKQAALGNDGGDKGWMLVHESPRAPMLLSVCVGSGLQILCTVFFVLLFAAIGILSPPNRGAFVIAILIFYALFGCVAGYSSTTIYSMVGGLRWKTNVLMTAFFVPGIAFSVFFVLNLFLWGAGSSAAIPFTTLLALLCLWFGVSLIFTILGSSVGYCETVPEDHVKIINPHPAVPDKDHLLSRLIHFIFTSLLLGDFPFLCVFVQVLYVFDSLWSDQIYYMFGSMMMAFIVLVLTCAETSVVICYCHLRRGDYRSWWWKSFLTTGTNALAFFIFAVHFVFYKTAITGLLSYLLYFGYTFIIAFLFFVMAGSIGFLSSLLFVRKIYSLDHCQSEPVASQLPSKDPLIMTVIQCKHSKGKGNYYHPSLHETTDSS